MSTFIDFQTRSILHSTQLAPTTSHDEEVSTPRQERLQGLVGQLSKPLAKGDLIKGVKQCLQELTENTSQNDAEQSLEWASLSRAILGTYNQLMVVLLAQATEADEEAEWWRRVSEVGGGTAWYLLQTMPFRLSRLGHSMVSTIRSHERQVTLSTFSLTNLDRIFPQNLLSHLFKHSFFPHLKHPYDIFRTNPLDLTRRECATQKHRLLDLRDRRAQSLGMLSNLRPTIEQVLLNNASPDQKKDDVATVLEILELSLRDDPSLPPVLYTGQPIIPSSPRVEIEKMTLAETSRFVLPRLHVILSATLPTYESLHDSSMEPLRRPSRLTRLWPKLVFYPPIAFIAFRMLFKSRAQVYQTIIDAKETIVGFWNQWVVEPVVGILNTVRTGGPEATIVSKDGLHSDMESLERMVVDLARDKLEYTPEQLDVLTQQVRSGDLTAVLKLYERDMKSPLKSAVTGNLIRSLLIQIQKTKVDVDVALSGIDKLLRSQELTFAFVGVAPSMVILWVFGSWARTLWQGRRGVGRLGGLRGRESAWIAIRRIERLLTNLDAAPNEQPTPITQGLLLMSVNRLRSYAVEALPPRSQLQVAFLEDIEDLEDPKGQIGRSGRLRVVDKMWRNWGRLLGWDGDAISAEGQ